MQPPRVGSTPTPLGVLGEVLEEPQRIEDVPGVGVQGVVGKAGQGVITWVDVTHPRFAFRYEILNMADTGATPTPVCLPVMTPYVRAEQRRRLARDAALRVLSRGEVGPEGLALRHVAAELDVPLSTLTHAYPSTGALFDDLAESNNTTVWDGLADDAGDAGLRAELRRAARSFLVGVLRDPGRRALILWQIQALARSEWREPGANVERATHLIDVIAERSGEHYRVAHGVLAHLILAFTHGEVIRWMATGDEQVYWSTVLAGIDGTVLLADPRPPGQPHPEPVEDYEGMPLPE